MRLSIIGLLVLLSGCGCSPGALSDTGYTILRELAPFHVDKDYFNDALQADVALREKAGSAKTLRAFFEDVDLLLATSHIPKKNQLQIQQQLGWMASWTKKTCLKRAGLRAAVVSNRPQRYVELLHFSQQPR